MKAGLAAIAKATRKTEIITGASFRVVETCSPRHAWIVSYNLTLVSMQQVADELTANGYTVQREESTGTITAYKDGELAATIK